MDVSVTIPIVVSETHFQNTTPSATDVRLDLLLRLNIENLPSPASWNARARNGRGWSDSNSSVIV
jgi:hypothetical protein